MLRSHDARFDFPLDGFFGEEDVDFRLVDLLNGRGTIVHLQEKVGSRGNGSANARGIFQRQCAWHPGPKKIAFGVEAKSKALVAGVGVLCIQVHGRARDVQTEDGVVGHISVAGPDLKRADGQVVVRVRGKHKHLVLVRHVAPVRVGLRHGHHQIRRANLAAVGEFGHAWVVGGIALRLAQGHPIAQDGFFSVGQHALSHKMRVGVVRGPRRHVVRGGHVFDELTVGKHLGIGGQRHGADFAHAVAFRAMLEDNGGDIGVVRDALRLADQWQEHRRDECAGEKRTAHGFKLGKVFDIKGL